MKMDISVIIPVYNVEPYVAECIKSVMAQKNVEDVNVECLIVDDCGTDNSMEVVRETLRDYTGAIKFRIITRDTNGGLSAARNSGIREAKGEYLYFLDSDDLITPDCLLTFWKQVLLHPGVDLVYGDLLLLGESRTTKQPLLLKDLDLSDYSAKLEKVRQAYFKLPIAACNKLINRGWLQSRGLYFTEKIIHEDVEWTIRAYTRVRSYALNSVSDPTYLYRQRPCSIMSSTSRYQKDQYMSNLFCSVYEKLPYWDSNLSRYLMDFLFAFRLRFSTTKLPEYKVWYKKILNKLYNSANCHIIHRILISYINLGRPWSRVFIYRFFCSFIKSPIH